MLDHDEKSTMEQVEHREDQSAVLSPLDDDFQVPKGYWYSYRFVGSMIGIVLLANNLFIGYAMPANAISLIDAELGPDPNVYLATLVNTLVKGVGLLLVGSISDVLGRRWFMIGGQGFGFIGACMAARATSINMIIGANLFIGIGGATQVLYPLLVHEIVPNKYRGHAQAFIMFAVLPTLGLGPVWVRMFVQYTALKWRWIYWLHAITTSVSALLFFFCYHTPGFEQLARGVSKKQQLKQIDYIGFALYAGGLVSLLLGLAWGGRLYAWDSARVIATMVVGCVVLTIFGFYEAYAPLKSPLFPMHLFKIRNFTIAVVVGSVGQMAFYSLNVLWPQHISRLYTTDNMKVGWMSCTTGLALAAGECLSGPFCKKGMRIKIQMIVSVILLTLFSGIMALGDESEEKLAVAMTIVVGLFVGWIELITIVVAGIVIPPEHIGSGQAFFASTRAVSGTIVTSIYVAIQTNKFSSVLPGHITRAGDSLGLDSGRVAQIIAALKTKAGLKAVPDLDTNAIGVIQAALKKAYAASYSTTYLSSLAWGGLALICCFLAKNDMEDYFTSFVNKTVDAPHIEAVDNKEDVRKGEV